MGASIAYNLRQDGMTGRILVIERDATYTRAATPLSMGGVRQQYSVPCNIAMARYGLAFTNNSTTSWLGAGGDRRPIFISAAISCPPRHQSGGPAAAV